MPATLHPALGQRQRDPAGADRELERSALARELREPLHGGPDHGRVEHARRVRVVDRRDALAEVPLVTSHRGNSVPRRLRLGASAWVGLTSRLPGAARASLRLSAPGRRAAARPSAVPGCASRLLRVCVWRGWPTGQRLGHLLCVRSRIGGSGPKVRRRSAAGVAGVPCSTIRCFADDSRDRSPGLHLTGAALSTDLATREPSDEPARSNPPSGAKGRSVATLTTMPSTSPSTAPRAMAAPTLTTRASPPRHWCRSYSRVR